MNIRPQGSDFVCEVQLTLTGISILKKSEQKIYTLARMASAEELLGTFVFSEYHEFVVPKQKADGSPSSAKEARVNTASGAVRVLDKDGDTQFEAIQSTRAEDLEVNVKSRSPAVDQAHVLLMDTKDEQERAENAAEDVRVLVGRLQQQ